MEQTVLVGDRDDLLDILANEEYRETLSVLRARPAEVMSVTDLAYETHTHKPGGPAVTTIRLHHVILPKLDSAGLVNYDPVEHTVRSRSSERAEPWLDVVEN